LNKLFTEKVGKIESSAQGQDLAPFVGNLTKVKIPSEIKQPPLISSSIIHTPKKNIIEFFYPHASIVWQLKKKLTRENTAASFTFLETIPN
jgi:hypothetical protein